jgi:hypothetical protein
MRDTRTAGAEAQCKKEPPGATACFSSGFQQSLKKNSVSKIENKERVYTLSFTLYPVTEEQDSHNVKAPFGISIGFSPR